MKVLKLSILFHTIIPEFLKWTLPFLNLDMSTASGKCKIKNRMTNSVDPNETVHYDLFQLGLQCLHRYLFWSHHENMPI